MTIKEVIARENVIITLQEKRKIVVDSCTYRLGNCGRSDSAISEPRRAAAPIIQIQ